MMSPSDPKPLTSLKQNSSSLANILQKLSPVENAMFGFSLGLADVACTQWMLYCKNAAQQNLAISLNPFTLYRGSMMNLLNMCVLYGVQIPVAGITTKAITHGKPRRLSGVEQVFAGAVGGVVSGFVCSPMELVMIQQQRFGTSLVGTASSVMKTSGAFGVFRGLSMTCGREGVFSAGMLGIGPVIKRYGMEELQYSQRNSSIIAAVIGGTIVSTISHPLDTIKTCQQGDIQQAKFHGPAQTFRRLASEAGFKRFFSGWGWRTGRTIAQIFLLDLCRQKLPGLLFAHHLED